MMILFMGMVGAFMLYRSGKAITPKTQEGLLAAGFTVTYDIFDDRFHADKFQRFRLINFKV